MKLIVMVPCLNEELTLPKVIQTIPSVIPGVHSVETLIVDDGSTDNTVEVARRLGVNHIIKLKHHQGLAKAFQSGLDACLDLGADVIVNTDGDNQYPSEAIPQLVQPILRGEADIVIGDRQTQTVTEFSHLKKLLQRVGSWAVRELSGAQGVKDAVSGFRAYSRYAASRNYLTNSYSYTIESVIQAGKRGLRIVSVPIITNPKTRPSRLFRSIRGFVARSGTTLIRSYFMYEPLRTFTLGASLSIGAGLVSGGSLIYFVVTNPSGTHVLALSLTVAFIMGGVLLATIGVLADHIAANRKLLEELVWREKAASRGLFDFTLGLGTAPSRQADYLIPEATSIPEQAPVEAGIGSRLDGGVYELAAPPAHRE
jgi:glycosyltransferase involved in cell wall biosynthesis